MNLIDLLKDAISRGVSDIYIVPGSCIMAKSGNNLIPLDEKRIMPDDSIQLIHQVYSFSDNRSMERLMQTGDDDFSFSLSNVGRFRCNAYKQRSSIAAVLRVVPFGLADPQNTAHPRNDFGSI